MPRANPLRARADRENALEQYRYCSKWLKVKYISRQLGMPQVLENLYRFRKKELVSVRTVLVMLHLYRTAQALEAKVRWMRENIVEKSRRRPRRVTPRP